MEVVEVESSWNNGMSTGLRIRKLSLKSVLSPIADVTSSASASMSPSCEGSTGLCGNHQRLWDNVTPVVSQGRQPAFLLSRCGAGDTLKEGNRKSIWRAFGIFFHGGAVLMIQPGTLSFPAQMPGFHGQHYKASAIKQVSWA